jgi:hypothetical protein
MRNAKWVLLGVLVVSILAVGQAIAAQITATKDTEPISPNTYHVGDTIHYKMTVSNPGGNTATNDLNDIYDLDPNGDTIYFVEPGVDLPLEQLPGDSNTFYYDYVVAQDNLKLIGGRMRVVNTFHASGIDSLDDTPTATVPKNSTILTPCIDVNKTVEPTLSKVGDEVVYTYRICNCGDANLTVTELVDDVLGEIDVNDCNFLFRGLYNGSGELQTGQCCTIELDPYKIPADACDPLINEACVTGVDVIGGEVNSCDTAMVDLVHPDVNVVKTCPAYSKVGDIIDYNVVITNTGDADLQIIDVNDSLAGLQTSCDDQVLAPAATCELSYTYQVKQGDPNPLINTVTVRAQVVGLSNILTETSGCETELIEPNLTVAKECLTDPVTGDVAQFRITIRNTGDVNLIIETNEPELPGPNTIVPAQTIILDVNRIVPGAVAEVNNSITVTATLPAEYDLSNVLTKSASAICTVEAPGNEGCTLGFWKNNADKHEANAWVGYTPDQLYSSVFGRTITIKIKHRGTFNDPNLLEALNASGGGINNLARQSVAALLNITSDCVNYKIGSATDLIAMVQSAIDEGNSAIGALGGLLNDYNETYCPIDQQGRCSETDGTLP